MLASFATDIAVMIRDMTHIKDPTNQETVYRAFQEEVFLPLAESIGAGLGIPDGRRGEFYAWAYLGLVNTFIGKSERLAIPPELLAEQLVAFFFEGAVPSAPESGLRTSQPASRRHDS